MSAFHVNATSKSDEASGESGRGSCNIRTQGLEAEDITGAANTVWHSELTFFDFCLMPGLANDLGQTDTLVRDLTVGHLLADRAIDTDWLRNDPTDRGIALVTPPKPRV